MADTKISALPASTTPLAGTEVLPIVQSAATKQVSVANLTAGRDMTTKSLVATNAVQAGNGNTSLEFSGTIGYLWTYSGNTLSFGVNGVEKARIDSSDNLKLNTGNLVPATAAKGVNFTANTPAAGMTSQLLNWYEEGTWTPTINFGGGATGITYSRQNGRYTRVGKLVTVTWDVRLSNKGSSTGVFTLAGLPFSAEGAGGGYSTSQFYFYSGFTTIKKMGTSYTNGGTTLNEVVDSADVAVSDTHFTNTSILFGSLTYIAA